MSDSPAAPSTPEGRLIRYHMAQARPRLTDTAMAIRLGWTRDKFSMTALGRTRGRRGAKEYHPSDADLVTIAVELGIAPGELEEAGRPEAAKRLRLSPQPASAPEASAAALDALFDLLVRERERQGASPNDRATLEYLWRATDGDLNLKPVAERVRDVIGWCDGPGRLAAVKAV